MYVVVSVNVTPSKEWTILRLILQHGALGADREQEKQQTWVDRRAWREAPRAGQRNQSQRKVGSIVSGPTKGYFCSDENSSGTQQCQHKKLAWRFCKTEHCAWKFWLEKVVHYIEAVRVWGCGLAHQFPQISEGRRKIHSLWNWDPTLE